MRTITIAYDSCHEISTSLKLYLNLNRSPNSVMKKISLPLVVFTFLSSLESCAQSCDEMISFVKSKSRGTAYTSYTSDAISKVTFYDVYIDYRTYHFAIVCFKRDYSYKCSEYIYQVGSKAKLYYSMNYLDIAGKAFWKYIRPYNDNLKCAPNFN